MIMLLFGYFMMGLIFLVVRFFYRVLPKKTSQKNLVRAVKDDLTALYAYAKQIAVSNPRKSKTVVVLIVCLIILPMTPLPNEIEYTIEDFLSAIMFAALVIIFAPREKPLGKGLPVEVFGFIYSIIFMYYSAGCLLFDAFYLADSLKEDMWMYGYGITMISYVICISTLSRFMEHELSKQEIILLGMIMMTTLEFITYYGVGFSAT